MECNAIGDALKNRCQGVTGVEQVLGWLRWGLKSGFLGGAEAWDDEGRV